MASRQLPCNIKYLGPHLSHVLTMIGSYCQAMRGPFFYCFRPYFPSFYYVYTSIFLEIARFCSIDTLELFGYIFQPERGECERLVTWDPFFHFDEGKYAKFNISDRGIFYFVCFFGALLKRLILFAKSKKIWINNWFECPNMEIWLYRINIHPLNSGPCTAITLAKEGQGNSVR